MNNASYSSHFYSPILIGITLLIALFVLQPAYENMMSEEITNSTLSKTKNEKTETLSVLKKMQKELEKTNTWTSLLAEKVKRLDKKWNSADIISAVMLTDYTLSNSFTVPRISIGGISVSEGTKLPSGLSLGNVSVSVSATSLDAMIEFITYLTQKSPYVFTIDSISLPIDTGEPSSSSDGITLSLSLGVYYYE